MIDIIKAKQAFKEYIQPYTLIENGKIETKIAHIQRVSRNMQKYCI